MTSYTFIDAVKAELIKSKRTYNLTMMCLLPLLCTGIISWYFVNYQKVAGTQAWNMYITRITMMYYLMYPLIIALTAYSISNIEHKNNMFKQFYTFPMSRFTLYMSKVVVLTFWITCSLILAFVFAWLGGMLVSVLSDDLDFGAFMQFEVYVALLLRYFITLMALASIHFLISIYWNNLILSLGSAIFLSIVGTFMAMAGSGAAFPYSNLMRSNLYFTLKQGVPVLDEATLWCMGYTILFFALGYFMMGRKQIK